MIKVHSKLSPLQHAGQVCFCTNDLKPHMVLSSNPKHYHPISLKAHRTWHESVCFLGQILYIVNACRHWVFKLTFLLSSCEVLPHAASVVWESCLDSVAEFHSCCCPAGAWWPPSAASRVAPPGAPGPRQPPVRRARYSDFFLCQGILLILTFPLIR